MGVYLLLAKQPSENPARPGICSNLRKSLFAGILNPLAYYLVLLFAYNKIQAQEAQVLNYTWAIVLAAMSILIRKEKFRSKDFIALMLSLVGVFIIAGKVKLSGFEFESHLGTALALGSSVLWAPYWIISINDPRPPVERLFYNFLVGSIGILILSMTGLMPLMQEGTSISIFSIGAAVYVGLFEMGLSFVMWLKALSLSDSTAKISNLIFVTPFLSLGLISLVLKESIHPATVVGLILIILSNLYQKSGRKYVNALPASPGT